MKYSAIRKPAYIISACLLMTGCSGEPSEADIRQVLESSMNKANEQMNKMGGEVATSILGKSELHSVKKLGCKEAENDSGYNCDVEIDMSVPFLGRQTRTQSQRFVESDDGWVVIER